MSNQTEMTFSDAIALIQAAFMRSGALLDIDKIIDERDGFKRVLLVAVVLSRTGTNDAVIANVIKKTNLLGILKKEAMERSTNKEMEKK